MGKIKYMIEEEVKKYSDDIYRWYKKNKGKKLSIITVPFNNTEIFSKIIFESLNIGGRVLYLWNRNEENVNLLSELKKNKKNITSTFIDEGQGRCDINFSNYNNVNYILGEYDLVIFDDISNYSSIDSKKIKEIKKNLEAISKKIIFYSVEYLIKEGDSIEIIPTKRKNPYVEPRILNTRIDLNKDIPYILYEYIKWFNENKRKIVIIVPDEERLNSVYEYYTKKLKMKRINIVPLLKGEDKNIIKNVLNKTEMGTIIITNVMEERLEGSSIGNAVVLFADSSKYNYKKILYLCGEMGLINQELPEVLLVSREVSSDMDKVKDITRDYNKKKWESCQI